MKKGVKKVNAAIYDLQILACTCDCYYSSFLYNQGIIPPIYWCIALKTRLHCITNIWDEPPNQCRGSAYENIKIPSAFGNILKNFPLKILIFALSNTLADNDISFFNIFKRICLDSILKGTWSKNNFHGTSSTMKYIIKEYVSFLRVLWTEVTNSVLGSFVTEKSTS